MSQMKLAIREPITLEKRESGPPKITGYAAVYYDGTPETEYQIAEGYAERLFPGCFQRMMDENQDVRGLFNHDPNMILGRRSCGTMKLSLDKRGLKYEIEPPDSPLGKTVAESLRRGDVDGSSFSFSLGDYDQASVSYRMEGETKVREIRDIREVHDVGPVVFPAYRGTSAMCRNQEPEAALAEFGEWEKRESQRKEMEERIAKLKGKFEEVK